MGCWTSPYLIIVVMFASTSGQSTQAGKTLCSNPPPGVAKMNRGVDLATLDMMPLDFKNSGGYRSPVIDLTCNKGHNWTSPSGRVYQLPDQIWQISTKPAGLTAKVDILKNRFELRSWLRLSIGDNNNALNEYAFSGSNSFVKMQNTFANTSRYVEEVIAFESSTMVDFVPSWKLNLSEFAKEYMDDMINETFQSNSDVYYEFIREFGTHYFSIGNFGGFIRTHMETEKDHINSRSERDIITDATSYFWQILDAHGGISSDTKLVTDSFRNATSVETIYYGGNTNLLASDGIETWQSTVDNDPWLFSGVLRPITELITDSQKKAGMAKAIRIHILLSYLQEIRRSLVGARTKESFAILDSFENKIRSIRQAPFDNVKFETIRSNVSYQVFVPSWFRESTKFCFKWRPGLDGRQCGGGAERLLCAAPNSRTSVYLDDTDGRLGGCRMQWGITSSNYPSWFANVRVCYRWLAERDRTQCGGDAGRLMCAKIGSFTPEYLDNTDGRSGGCMMSWKLDIPDTAPLWLKTSTLCFYWSATGNSGQCGGEDVSQTLCATDEAWTPYYNDNTDIRNGGCEMSWALNVIL